MGFFYHRDIRNTHIAMLVWGFSPNFIAPGGKEVAHEMFSNTRHLLITEVPFRYQRNPLLKHLRRQLVREAQFAAM